MNIEHISEGYANALCKVAQAEGCLEKVVSEMTALKDALASNTELKNFLKDPFIKEEGKRKGIAEIFESTLSPVTQNIVMMIIGNGKGLYLSSIIEDFFKVVSSLTGKVNAEITTSVSITDEVFHNIRTKLVSMLGKDILLRQKVDESIVGGMIIKIGDKVIDSSVRRKLDEMKKQIRGAYEIH